jgi:hypothetical protein
MNSPSWVDGGLPASPDRAIIVANGYGPDGMQRIMKTFALVILSGLIAACATQKQAPATAVADPHLKIATDVGAASAPAGTTPVSAVPAADQAADSSSAVNENLVKHGFKPIHQNGQLLYCRSEVLTGTHFPQTVCLTEAQLRASERGRQQLMDTLNKGGGIDCSVIKCGQ